MSNTRILLNSKLHRPRVTRGLVVRPRLLERMDAGLDGPLTLVVAPAGFGKTTLVSSWVDELSTEGRPGIGIVPTVWLSLDDEETNPYMFLRYFISALRTIFPNAAPQAWRLITAGQDPPIDYLAAMLSNEIEALPADFIMVLDDIHAVQGQDIYDIVAAWMRHWPRPMHLVLISRRNPALSLTNWRARGKVVELRPRDLRFTKAETAEFLTQVLGDDVDAATAVTLHEQMDGWITGLRLASLSLDRTENLAMLLPDVTGGDVYIADYLLEEVFLHQPAEIQQFLLKICVVRQFCESLCIALLDEQHPDCNVRQCLDYLVENELFQIGLDENREWYRLHHLFRSLLMQRVLRESGRDQLDRLHWAAAQWNARHGFQDEALYHARETGDAALLQEIMQQGLCDVLNNEDRPTLERWLTMLSSEAIENSPELLIMRAWDHGFRWELSKVELAVDKAEALLEETLTDNARKSESDLLRGQIAALRGHIAHHTNQPELGVAHCLMSLELMPESWRYVRGTAAGYLGLNLQASGRAAEAEKVLTSRYEALPDKTDSYALRLMLGLTWVALQSGHLRSALRITQTMVSQSEGSDLLVMQGWSHYLAGYVHYQIGEHEAAAVHFAKVAAMPFTTQLLVARNAMAGLAFTHQVLGRFDQALAQIDELGQLDLYLYGRETGTTAGARAWLYYRQGDLDRAEAWLDGVMLPPPGRPIFLSDWTLFTQIGVLIARKDSDHVQLALDSLDQLDELAAKTYNQPATMVLLAWRAMAEMARGDLVAARRALVRSVGMARLSGHRQIYADLGLPMQQLLGQITGEQSLAVTLSEIRATFEANGLPTYRGNGFTSAADAADIRLSKRELQILALMAEPVSFNQISSQLNIAPATTKRHSINLYDKLGSHSRWEAVARAVELGILPAK